MRNHFNKKNTLFRFLMGKSVVFFMLLSLIATLNGWKPEKFAKKIEMRLYQIICPQNNIAAAPGSAFAVSDISHHKAPAAELSAAMALTPKQKLAEKRYHHIVLEAAARYQVEPDIIKAIIMAESGFNPKAVSKVGARGLMQLMPRTAKFLGVKDSFKPDHNIDAGVRYFKQLLDQFDGKVKLALAAYNAGLNNVRKYGGIPPFKATQIYIDKVLKYYEAYQTT